MVDVLILQHRKPRIKVMSSFSEKRVACVLSLVTSHGLELAEALAVYSSTGTARPRTRSTERVEGNKLLLL